MTVNIAGKEYAHITTKIERKAKIIYSENNGDTISGKSILDPLHTKVYYHVELDSMNKDQDALQQIWDDIIKPRRWGFYFEAPYNQETLSFNGYIEGDIVQGLYRHTNGKNIWDKIAFDIYPTEPQFTEVLI